MRIPADVLPTLPQKPQRSRKELQSAIDHVSEALTLELGLAKKYKMLLECELGMALKAMCETKQQPQPDNCLLCRTLGDTNKTAADNLRQ